MIHEKGNRTLWMYNIYNPLLKKEDRVRLKKMAEEYKEATAGDVVKFENEGDSLEGKYRGYEESKEFKGSFALRIETTEGLKCVFVSGIAIDLIKTNSIQEGGQMKIEFTGMKTSEKSKREYKTYKVFYK